MQHFNTIASFDEKQIRFSKLSHKVECMMNVCEIQIICVCVFAKVTQQVSIGIFGGIPYTAHGAQIPPPPHYFCIFFVLVLILG